MRNELERPRQVVLDKSGPLLVDGPVTVVGDDGSAVTSDRFKVAICTCRRSRSYPWCDTSHRARSRTPLPHESRTDHQLPGSENGRSR